MAKSTSVEKKQPSGLRNGPKGKEKELIKKGGGATSKVDEAKIVDWEQLPGLADDLPGLAAEYLALNEQAKGIDARKKELQEAIKAVHTAATLDVIGGDFFVCEMVTSHKPKKLDKMLLLECGVDMEVIDACMAGGEEYTYLTVRPRAQAEQEG